MIDLDATLAMVRVANPPQENESDQAYAARSLHLMYLLVEHSPQNAVLMPEQDKEENEL